jgi:hypothetical protein
MTGHHAASPLTLWLRVPLAWYTSATFAQFPDETRSSIQRSFASPFAGDHRRVFCGYCGTPLSSWNERTREDAEHISLTVGSLLDDDQELLAELGLLPSNESSESSDEDTTQPADEPAQPTATRPLVRSEPRMRGAPWFDDMVQHTRLGRFKQQRGRHMDGRVQVEWEVTEWIEGDDTDEERTPGSATPSKRKISQIEATEDSEMRND